MGSGIEGVARGSSERTVIGADKTKSRPTKRALARNVKRMFSSMLRPRKFPKAFRCVEERARQFTMARINNYDATELLSASLGRSLETRQNYIL